MSLALLVDRDADTRQMYAEFLRMSAFQTDEAEDGREALAKAISRCPSVIVTETRLPGMSGLELCRVLRSDALTRAIPIIVVTADGLETNVRLAEAAGADAVLVKPCMPDQLVDHIRQLLSQSSDLKDRSRALYAKIGGELARSQRLIESSTANRRRVALSRVHKRGATTNPPARPPALLCPACDRAMKYVVSQLGGVSERLPEQWDYFECARCGRTIEYRQRTRRVRAVDPIRS